jgi:hypothetical protein
MNKTLKTKTRILTKSDKKIIFIFNHEKIYTTTLNNIKKNLPNTLLQKLSENCNNGENILINYKVSTKAFDIIMMLCNHLEFFTYDLIDSTNIRLIN